MTETMNTTKYLSDHLLGLEVTFFSHFTETHSSSRNPLGNGSLCSGSLAPVTLNSSCISTLIPTPSLRDGDQQTKFSFSRDDALLLWSALTTFVKDIITLYYKSDDDVTKDVELQAWIKDLHDNGLPVREGDEDHEVPSALQTREFYPVS